MVESNGSVVTATVWPGVVVDSGFVSSDVSTRVVGRLVLSELTGSVVI